MKILLTAPHPFFSPRGTPIAEKLLIEVLCEAGHEVDVLTLHLGDDVEVPGCTIHRIPSVPGVRSLPTGFTFRKLVCDAVMLVSLFRLVRKNSYDVIHAVEESAFLALLCRWFRGPPFVYDMDSSLAGQMVEQFSPLEPVKGLLEWFEGFAVRGATGVLTMCTALKEVAQRYDPSVLVGVAEDITLLRTLPAGDTTPMDEVLESLSVPVVMYVGNLAHYQGIDILLEGFARIPAGLQAHLVIVGGGPELEHHTRHSAALGIEGRVTFLGPRPLDMLPALLSRADILVSPRRKGVNTPMKIYSYLDSGRPLVATNLSTHTQVLDDDIAVLVEDTPEGLGQGIGTLLESPDYGRELAQRAGLKVQEEYTKEAFQRKVLSFYEAVERAIASTPPL